MLKVFIIFMVAIMGIMNIILMSSRKKIAKKIRQNIREEEERERNTPKQLFGMEANVLPFIVKDYPNLNVDKFKADVKETIVKYLKMKEERAYSDINATDEYKSVLKNSLNTKVIERFNNIKIHDIIIKKYDEKGERHILIFQLSLEYYYSNNDSKEIKTQDRFELEYIDYNNKWKLNSVKSV